MYQKYYTYNKVFLTLYLLFLLFTTENCQAKIILKKDLLNKQDSRLINLKTLLKKTDANSNNSDLHSKVNKVNQKKNLFYTANAEDHTSVWSNAFNFHKSWGTQVDPRTGTLSAYVKVGSLISNLNHGPNITLDVNYNSDSIADPDGIGAGWSWNLTHFNPKNNQLSTSQGQIFILQQQPNGNWWPRYHKLRDIQITGSKESHFVITYTNGLRETLDHDGYEVLLEQQDGYYVRFSYLPGLHRLSAISDGDGHKITLTRNKGYLTISSTSSDKKLVNIQLHSLYGKLQTVTLSDINSIKLWKIHFSYLGLLLTKVSYPTGLEKEMHYNCTNAMKIALNHNKQFSALCVVVQEMVIPGAAQPIRITRYTYGQTSNSEHNYLAFNSGLTILPKEEQDILFSAPIQYNYKTTKDNGIIKQIQTYNKYHLLIDTQIISDSNDHLISQTHNFFCYKDKLDGCAYTSFENLPDTYSLPLKVVTKDWGESSDHYAVEMQYNTYDSTGRIISKTDAYGRTEKISYCPVQGDIACPAEPDGWRLRSQAEFVTRYPSAKIPDLPALSPITLHNYYRKEPNLNGHGYILKLAQKVVQTNNDRLTTKYIYYDNVNNNFTYGLLKQKILSRNSVQKDQLTTLTKNYYYTINADHSEKTIYTTIDLGNKKVQKSSIQTISLFTNQLLKQIDAEEKKVIRYHYDHWGRLTEKILSAAPAFIIKEQYNYIVSPQLNQVIVTTANGLQQKIRFDGAGDKLNIFTEALTVDGKAAANRWRPTQRITYDSYGRIASKTVYIADQSDHQNKLITTFDYDAMDRPVRTHLPDREINIKQYDNPDRCTISYTEDAKGQRSPLSVVRGNLLDKPVMQAVLPAFIDPSSSLKKLCLDGDKLPEAKVTTTRYDGFGRVIAVTTPDGGIVTKHYDSIGHLTAITNPHGETLFNVYNLLDKVIEKWVQPANESHQYLLFSAHYNSDGELLWKAGEDKHQTFYTYTADGQPRTITTPSKHIIAWKYNSLALPVSKSVDGKIILTIAYDPLTMLPVKKTDLTGTSTYRYSDDGKLQQLIHTGKNSYSDYRFQWEYNRNRQVISVSDLSGNSIQTTYDHLGRINGTYYRSVNTDPQQITAPSYDGFSRIAVVDYGSGMQRTIHYNDYGEQDKITDLLVGKLLSQWQFNYDSVGNITTLIQNTSDNKQARLSYQYDKLDNLTTVNCSGSAGLPLCPRDTEFEDTDLKEAPVITRQTYTFNPFNRIAKLQELLTNADKTRTLSKVITYNYDDKVPLRLQNVTTQWNHKTQQIHTFVYDASGNMVADGSKSHMTYNAFNEITSVVTSAGQHSRYVYDGSEREVKEITANNDIRYLFYIHKHLLGEKIVNTDNTIKIVGYLGNAKTINGIIHDYYEKNYKGDITAVLNQVTYNHYKLKQFNIYSPYGMVWHDHVVTDLPLYQQILQGFDGEQTDPATGWQFLGAGHRVYSPQQRYFVSEDPLGDGYAFGSNNPVMNTDPSGNVPRWIGSILHVVNLAGTLGFAAIHRKWSALTGNLLMTGLSVALGGYVMAYFGASREAIIASTAFGVCAAAVNIAAAAEPASKGLNIASMVMGITTAVIALAAVGSSINATTMSFSSSEGTLFESALSYFGIDAAGYQLRGDSLFISSDEHLNRLWESYQGKTDIYTSSHIPQILGLAADSNMTINTDHLDLLIKAEKQLFLPSGARDFNIPPYALYVKQLLHVDDNAYVGYGSQDVSIENIMQEHEEGFILAYTADKQNTFFMGYITREYDRIDNGASVSQWGMYLAGNDGKIRYTVGSLNKLVPESLLNEDGSLYVQKIWFINTWGN